MNRAVEACLAALGMALALLVAVQVFFRYALNDSLFWSEEAARFMLTWLTFLGASAAYRRGAHAGVDLLTSRLSPGARQMAGRAVHLLALAFFGLMIFYGIQFAHFIRLQISPSLGLPKWLPLGVIPLSGAIMALHAARGLANGGKGGRA